MRVFINGQARDFKERRQLADILKDFSIPDERIAVEVNKEVVRKKDWPLVEVKDADNIEIVHFVGGG